MTARVEASLDGDQWHYQPACAPCDWRGPLTRFEDLAKGNAKVHNVDRHGS